MANTFTGLTPILYEALDTISREMVGMIPAVTRDTEAERAAVGQSVNYPVVSGMVAGNITPGIAPPTPVNVVSPAGTLTIQKSRSVPFSITGDESVALRQSSAYRTVNVNSFAQAMRTLVNEIEVDLALAGKLAASRAYGSAGVAPFATAGDLSDLAYVRKVLEDNGAPMGDLHLVLTNASAANIRAKQSGLFRVNEAGTDEMLRKGNLGQIEGFAMHQSAGLQLHTKGGANGAYVTNGATAIGGTSIALITGAGTLVAGDVVSFAADTGNKYVVNTGIAGPGTVVLNKPGAMMIIPTANALTLGANYTPNLAFDRGAIVLATRAPAVPAEGDLAIDSMIITDPVSGLSFEVRVYAGYHQNTFDVGIAWGVAAVKSENIAILLS
jgi:hypothetical protein